MNALARTVPLLAFKERRVVSFIISSAGDLARAAGNPKRKEEDAVNREKSARTFLRDIQAVSVLTTTFCRDG